MSHRDLHWRMMPEDFFLRMLRLERRRAERSRKPFLLMVLDCGALLLSDDGRRVLKKILRALCSSTRETDIAGWYETGSKIGLILTEVEIPSKDPAQNTVLRKIDSALRRELAVDQLNQIRISSHYFPEDRDQQRPSRPADSTLYPDLMRQAASKRLSQVIKRGIDIAGSLFALILFAPLFALIAVAIKLSPQGPILFKQERVGQYGVNFTFLKFRSMYCSNDAAIHKEYLKRFIAGELSAKPTEEGQKTIFKITADPRVTPVGKFLRKTSLDELPQFLNVLQGKMSLVGPRPPIPYELESYDIWHRARLLEAKPGITGLWQVSGRSRMSFDDMVRLDLQYARTWSLWLDIKILLQTPRAVFSAEGAY